MSLSQTVKKEKSLILLIEDNQDDERLTLRALSKNNVMNEVVVAVDGQEALDYLFGQGKHDNRDLTIMPAVVILDLKLPKISGLEVLKEIRAANRTSTIPVVVMTSSEDPQQVSAAYQNGANSFVRKPHDHREFSETILQVAMYWLLVNETI